MKKLVLVGFLAIGFAVRGDDGGSPVREPQLGGCVILPNGASSCQGVLSCDDPPVPPEGCIAICSEDEQGCQVCDISCS